jgi:branched-chain amino acid transport system ATP-binding protein/nonpolar-amino-acid-transporting ATPase
MAAEALLQVRGLAHRFGAVQVLNDVNLEVPAAGLVGLIGPNGSGKTTLFNLISGYIEPVAGCIDFAGQPMAGLPVERRSRAGLMRTFQTPKVFESMSVLENVMLGCAEPARGGMLAEMFALPAAARALAGMREQAEQLCQRFELWELRHAASRSLPAGQRRLLEICRAVAAAPRLLMLDEPSSGLNDAEVQTLEHRIHALRDDGIAVLLVSHDMGLMAAVDHVHLLCNGELLASGPMAQLKDDPRVREVYLGA